jgi:hypothetical protein
MLYGYRWAFTGEFEENVQESLDYVEDKNKTVEKKQETVEKK